MNKTVELSNSVLVLSVVFEERETFNKYGEVLGVFADVNYVTNFLRARYGNDISEETLKDIVFYADYPGGYYIELKDKIFVCPDIIGFYIERKDIIGGLENE